MDPDARRPGGFGGRSGMEERYDKTLSETCPVKEVGKIVGWMEANMTDKVTLSFDEYDVVIEKKVIKK